MYYTPKQLAIVRFLVDYKKKHGVSPTLEEIGKHTNVSKITVFEHIGALERKGAVIRDKGRSRSVRVIDPEQLDPPRYVVPLAGVIAAGKPIEAIETHENLDFSSLIPNGNECFALRVKGDSMIDEHIRDGDFVIVEKRSDASDGDMVVAILEEQGATLKRFYRENGKIRLQPANDKYDPIFIDKIDIRGVVLGILRKY